MKVYVKRLINGLTLGVDENDIEYKDDTIDINPKLFPEIARLSEPVEFELVPTEKKQKSNGLQDVSSGTPMPKIKPAKDSEQKEKQVIKEIKPKDLTEFLEENNLELNWTVSGEARNEYYFKLKDFIVTQDTPTDSPFEKKCFPARSLDAALVEACEELSLKGIQPVNSGRKEKYPFSFPVLSHDKEGTSSGNETIKTSQNPKIFEAIKEYCQRCLPGYTYGQTICSDPGCPLHGYSPFGKLSIFKENKKC